MKEVRMECLRTPYVVSPNPLASMARMLPVHANMPIYPLGNFITDATVHPSNGRPSGHCPCPRPSVRSFDNPGIGWTSAARDQYSTVTRISWPVVSSYSGGVGFQCLCFFGRSHILK
jgi:hypothetical protein